MLDFIDFGCGEGGSMNYIKGNFSDGTGWGIETDIKKAGKCFENGNTVLLADICDDSLELPKCRFITMIHVLEHLNNINDVKKVIKLASETATDFILIRGPNFDERELLSEHNLKFAWETYIGHTTHLTITMIYDIVKQLKLDAVYGFSYKIEDSSDREIVPYNAPDDTVFYDESLGEKPIVSFERLYREIYALITLRNIDYWNDLMYKINI